MEQLEQIRNWLKHVNDPELGVNIIDLGLVYGVEYEDGHANISMTLTTPGCPLHDTIVGGVRQALHGKPGIEDVQVDVVWEPRWSPEMMSEAAREQLDYF